MGNSSSLQAADEGAVRALYQAMIVGWNRRDAAAMAAPFAEDGELIGFDGSQVKGRAEIEGHLAPIFAGHPTAPYIAKVKEIRFLSSDVALLQAIVGMVPPGQSELNPGLNAHQTVVAVKRGDTWAAALLQTTPAQFHGRPDLVQQMTEELQQLL